MSEVKNLNIHRPKIGKQRKRTHEFTPSGARRLSQSLFDLLVTNSIDFPRISVSELTSCVKSVNSRSSYEW